MIQPIGSYLLSFPSHGLLSGTFNEPVIETIVVVASVNHELSFILFHNGECSTRDSENVHVRMVDE